MNRFATASVAIGLACAATMTALAQESSSKKHTPQFEKPFRVQAGGEFIDVEIGHAAPLLVDWDGDSKRDLLVGQFGQGKLRIYTNTGTDTAPTFANDFKLFNTREGLGSIPSG